MLITRREVRDQLRDWRIVLPIVGMTLFFPLLMTLTANAMVNYVQKFGAEIIGERMYPFLMMVVGFFPSSISLVVALESFAGERERRTIEPLLAAPLDDAQLYLGKLLAVLFLPVSVSYVGIVVYLVGLWKAVHWSPPFLTMLLVFLLTGLQAVLMVSGAVVISTQATSVRSANLLASLIIVPVALLLQWESLNLFWQKYGVLWATAAVVTMLSVVAARLGIAHFNREDLLGREIDELNLRWLWRAFWDGFRGGAHSLREWLGVAKNDLHELRWVFLGSLVLLAAAGALGGWLTARYFPPSFAQQVQIADLHKAFTSPMPLINVPLMNWRAALAIWLHNVLTLTVASAAALFTLGVGGVLIAMLPFGIIGGGMVFVGKSGLMSPWAMLAFFILPHGIVEIPAIALYTAATLQMSASLIAPSPGKRLGEVWMHALARWLRVGLVWVIPMLAVAAVLETWLTPWVVMRYFGG